MIVSEQEYRKQTPLSSQLLRDTNCITTLRYHYLWCFTVGPGLVCLHVAQGRGTSLVNRYLCSRVTYTVSPFNPSNFINICLLTVSKQNMLYCEKVGIDHTVHLCNMKRKILSKCLKGKYGYHLREFSDTSFIVFGAERVNKLRPIYSLDIA